MDDGRKETVICYWLVVICLSGMRKSIADWGMGKDRGI